MPQRVPTFKSHLTEAFTRQHYEVVAKVLKSAAASAPASAKPTVDTIAKAFAAEFAHDNPNFNEIKFLLACK